ncbi:MAG: DUF4974 domain-containing protein, partial [Planctomycetes bacterium]|nr:DUF4974 domain-containing protein [Planctomycetota bacterium]
MTASFKNEPLHQVVKRLSKLSGLRIVLDKKTLAEEGVFPNDTISARLQNDTLANALEVIFAPLGLRHRIDKQGLVITTAADFDEWLYARRYNIRSLINAGYDPRTISDLVREETSGPWIDIDGSGGKLLRVGYILNIEQTLRVHREIEALLETIGVVAGTKRQSGALFIHEPTIGPLTIRLNRKVSFDYRKKPLQDVIRDLEKQTGVPLTLDAAALKEEGYQRNEPLVTAHCVNLTLRSALRLILDEFGLNIFLDADRIIVTSIGCACEHLTTAVHLVRDLVDAGLSADWLIEFVQQESSGPWFDLDGSGGTLSAISNGALIIRQTYRQQAEIAELFDRLRKAVRASRMGRLLIEPGMVIQIFEIAPSAPTKKVNPAKQKAKQQQMARDFVRAVPALIA